MTNLFDSSFTGFPGDEDNGSMSGWYVFSSMGFYPVTPGTGEYVLGIPLFDEVKINLPDGKEFAIRTHQNAPHHHFVQRVELNKNNYTNLFIKHDELVAGGCLDVTLALAPVYRDDEQDELPFSLSMPNN
jgi:putative alpha-1,2-mannosidase